MLACPRLSHRLLLGPRGPWRSSCHMDAMRETGGGGPAQSAHCRDLSPHHHLRPGFLETLAVSPRPLVSSTPKDKCLSDSPKAWPPPPGAWPGGDGREGMWWGLGTTAKAPLARLSSHSPKPQTAPADGRHLLWLPASVPEAQGKSGNGGTHGSAPGSAAVPAPPACRAHGAVQPPVALGAGRLHGGGGLDPEWWGRACG